MGVESHLRMARRGQRGDGDGRGVTVRDSSSVLTRLSALTTALAERYCYYLNLQGNRRHKELVKNTQ